MAKSRNKKLDDTKRNDLLIKGFVQTICTPIAAEKRETGIRNFFSCNQNVDFNENECKYIWKGLFYAIWYTEMGKGCEEIMEAIVEETKRNEMLLKTAFGTIKSEWFGIDAIRLDKFSYFVRRLVSTAIEIDAKTYMSGSDGSLPLMSDILEHIKSCHGLLFHVSSVYVEELIKCLKTGIDSKTDHLKTVKGRSCLMQGIKCFGELMFHSDDESIVRSIAKDIFEGVLQLLEDEESEAAPIIKKKIMKYISDNLCRLSSNRQRLLKTVFKLQERKTPMKRKSVTNSHIDDAEKRFVRSRIPLPVSL